MINIQRIFSLLSVLFFINTTEAQILKKIKKAVENKAEQKAVEKVSSKAEEEASKSIDTTISAEAKYLGYGINKVDASVVPDSYNFSWKYSMEIQNEKEKPVIIDYLLEPNSEYFAFNMGQSNEMLMIMDLKNKLMITCFNKNNEKMASASKIPDYSDKTKKEKDSIQDKFTYRTLPNKIFLGYNCKGIEATNAEFVMVFYYTNEAKISFADMFKSRQKQNTPDAFKHYFKPGDKPLMMYMDMKDLKHEGRTTTMKCIAVEKNSYTFVKSDYKFM